MGFWIPNGSKINLKQKRNFYPTRKHSCRQEVDLALVGGNSTNRQMMGALHITASRGVPVILSRGDLRGHCTPLREGLCLSGVVLGPYAPGGAQGKRWRK